MAVKYLNLTSEDYKTAYEITVKSWALAQRWSDISANAGKLASIKEVNKTDLSKWAYQRYRQLQLMHEHARSIWRIGEDFAKYLMKGDRK